MRPGTLQIGEGRQSLCDLYRTHFEAHTCTFRLLEFTENCGQINVALHLFIYQTGILQQTQQYFTHTTTSQNYGAQGTSWI